MVESAKVGVAHGLTKFRLLKAWVEVRRVPDGAREVRLTRLVYATRFTLAAVVVERTMRRRLLRVVVPNAELARRENAKKTTKRRWRID
jgi:hypothetical protein